jgi:hypothetical protein
MDFWRRSLSGYSSLFGSTIQNDCHWKPLESVKSPIHAGDFTDPQAIGCPNKAFYALKYNVFRVSACFSFSGIFIAK